MATEENISHTAKWRLDEIEKAAKELRAEIIRLEKALDESTGVVQTIQPYPVDKVTYQSHIESWKSPENARAAAESAYAESQAVREQNAKAIAENERIKKRLQAFIDNAKVPHTVQVRSKSRSRWSSGYKTEEAPWMSQMLLAIPTYDPWPTVEQRYRDWLKHCDEWRKKLDAATEAKKRAAEDEKKKLDSEILRREMVAKYQLADDAGFYSILDAIFKQDKYLRLAHYLQKNRGDWTDGCDYAERGLSGFTAEDEVDREIEKCIGDLCSDWDGDGRCFRDCKWSYDVLFQLAAGKHPEAMADYGKVLPYTESD